MHPDNKYKKAANISLVAVLLLAAGGLLAFFQTDYQLVSPLVPQRTFADIVRPFVTISLIGICGSIVGLIFYFYQRYLVTLIICSLLFIAELSLHF